MCEALRRVRDIAAAWCADPAHAESFPPMVFNITDGEATDCDDAELRAVAGQIKSLRTADGNVLLVNIHIAAGDTPRTVFFPSAEEASYPNRYAEVLYDCSSPMPGNSNEGDPGETKALKRPAAVPRHEFQRLGRRADHHAQHRFHQRKNRIAMTPTLQLFTRALLTPDLSFKTLADARAAPGADGLPRLMRTTRFAEAEITWRGRQWLLSMPLSPDALAAVERTASQLGRLNTDHLAEYRILRDELRWTDPAGRERRFDLALQHLPAGKPFAEALHTEPANSIAAVGTLETARS